MEYIKDNQPTTVMSLDDLNLHVPNIDKATLVFEPQSVCSSHHLHGQ